MFWSLVRPDRILPPITRSAAVITSLEAGEFKTADPSSLINSNKGPFDNGVPACLVFDLTTGRFAADGQVVDREREHPKMIMMQPMATRRAWAAVAGSLKIIDCLLEPKRLGIACRALGKRRQGGGDVIGCPVMPDAGRRVGIIAEKGEAAGTSRRIAPIQRRREVVAIAREASRDRRPVGKDSRIKLHELSPGGDVVSLDRHEQRISQLYGCTCFIRNALNKECANIL